MLIKPINVIVTIDKEDTNRVLFIIEYPGNKVSNVYIDYKGLEDLQLLIDCLNNLFEEVINGRIALPLTPHSVV